MIRHPLQRPRQSEVEAKRRQLGMTFEQVAWYLGWDPGTLTRYLNGTWRMSDERAAKLEAF
jgi:hypothetical protein